jgi:hypothetical protein
MANPWTAKMEQFTTFSEEDRRRLNDLASLRRQHY